MDFTLSTEQLTLCAAIEKLCTTTLNNNSTDAATGEVFPRIKWMECGRHTLMGLPIPKEFGGRGLTMLSTAIGIKTLARYCDDEGFVFSLCAHMLTCAVPIWKCGTKEQKKHFLPKLCNGVYIGGNGITESMAGSDASAMATTITKNPDTLCINGSKIFVTNGPIADLLILYAKHPQGMKMVNISAVIIEKGVSGFTIGQVFKKMGLDTSVISEVLFDNCLVPQKNIVGRERRGMEVFNLSMMWERIIMAAYHVGAMEHQYDLLVNKMHEMRNTEHEIISDILVDIKMRIKTSSLMLYDVCCKYDTEEIMMADAAMVKLISSESKVKNSIDTQKIIHHWGLVPTEPYNRQFRDSIASTIYSGTSQIQRKIIAESI